MKRKKSNTRRGLITAIVLLAILAAVLTAVALGMGPVAPEPTDPVRPSDPVTDPPTDPSAPPVTAPTTPTDPLQPTPPATDPTEPSGTEHVHGHVLQRKVDATCTTGGYSVYACYCGDSYGADHTDPLGHDFRTEVVEATHVAGGYSRHVCARCGYDYTDNYTDRIPYPTDAPSDPEGSMYNLVHGLMITDMGSYTGPYMEDGSDQRVSNVLMIVLTNCSNELLQYAQITLSGPSGTATFVVTTLPPGASVLLLEQNRMQDSPDLEFTSAAAQNVVFFRDEQSIHTDWFRFQGTDGGLTVTNISGAAISGDIEIYYKNMVDGQLYGGITYVCRISGGMALDETRQMVAGHFSASESVIMFVRVVS